MCADDAGGDGADDAGGDDDEPPQIDGEKLVEEIRNALGDQISMGEKIESNKLNDLDLTAAGGLEPQDEESEAPADEEGGDSEVRREVIRRLKKIAENDEEDDEEGS